MSDRYAGRSPSQHSRAELALNDLCAELGYCLDPEDHDAILAGPPPTADAFVEAVLIAEGCHPDLITKADKRPLLEIVNRRGVYSDLAEEQDSF